MIRDILRQRFKSNFVVNVNPVTDTVTTTPTLILRFNPNRFGFILYNLGNTTMFIGLNQNVSETYGILIPPNGGSVSVWYEEDYTLVENEFWAKTTTGTTKIYVLEYVGGAT